MTPAPPRKSAIPLVDLRKQIHSLEPDLTRRVRAVLREGQFIGGPRVAAFEAAFARHAGARGCVGVGNGTDALFLALRALGIGRGDEVITVAHTFAATAEAIVMAGATPVFVDVRPDTLLMDPDHLKNALTARTKAVIPVHLYGQMCDMDAVRAIARARGLRVIEDCAQAHGARWRGRGAGTWGDAGCFSFFPGKNLGALGDAGAVISNNTAFLKRVRRLANHGRREKYVHLQSGINSRLDSLQAAVLELKLQRLDAWTAARRRWAAAYSAMLEDLPAVTRPGVRPECDPVWHLYTVRVKDRDRLLSALHRQGIDAGVHYPLPLHHQPAFRQYARGRRLPVTETAARQVLSLPLYPELTLALVRRVVRAVRADWAEGVARGGRGAR